MLLEMGKLYFLEHNKIAAMKINLTLSAQVILVRYKPLFAFNKLDDM